MHKILIASLITGLLLQQAKALDVDDYRIVDLSHVYNDETLYWPTSPSKFALDELAYGDTPDGYFYSAYTMSTPEHGGTHLDAPIHFAARGQTAEAIPLQRLIAAGVVIDITEQTSTDRNYRLAAEDVLAHEREHGRIAAGTMVLLRTGWDEYWPHASSYLGDDTPGDASKLSFPSYGDEAARLLVEQREVAALGVDTASIDYGRSQLFTVHRIASARNVIGLENLTNLAALPPTGFTVIALPMKVEGGSGGPVRVVALVPKRAR